MSRELPNLGLSGGLAPGEDDWADDQNRNLLMLSVLVQGGVDGILSAVPGTPDPGEIVVLDETNVDHPNAVAVWEGPVGDEEWSYFDPKEGWLLWDKDQAKYITFDGTVWAVLETGGGGGGGVEEAPEDGALYGRKDAAWEEIVGADSFPDPVGNANKYLRVNPTEDGFVWAAVSGGGGGSGDGLTREVPDTSMFPYDINNVGITYTDTDFSLDVTQGNGMAFQTRGIFQDIPVGNFTCYMECDMEYADFGNNCRLGIGLRNSTSSRLMNFGLYTSSPNGLYSAKAWWNSPTSYAGDTTPGTVGARKNIWIRLEYDGTNLILSVGNGRYWLNVLTEAAASFIGAFDQIGIEHQFNNLSLWRITSFGFTDPAL